MEKLKDFVAIDFEWQSTDHDPCAVGMVKVKNNVVASVCHFVEEGQGVRIGELGILRPSINTRSAADGDDVEVEKVRVRWLPSKKVREAAAKFAIKKTGDESDVEIDDGDDNTSGGGGGQDFE